MFTRTVGSVGARLLLALFVSLSAFSLNLSPAQAGSGPSFDIPQSSIAPVMDGVCDTAEYADAAQTSITVGINPAFPIYSKHTSDYAYFCFGDASGLPLPAGGTPQVAVYIDPNHDGDAGLNDDFGIWMPYEPSGVAYANSWGTGFYDGADPGGWEAVKNQTLSPDYWQVEFRISRQTLGGWNHTVGLALFYHWWRFQSDDYSSPAGVGVWASPQFWANGALTTGTATVNHSPIVPVVDGLCAAEYADASIIPFTGPNGDITAYLKNTGSNLHVCLDNLQIPDPPLQTEPNAALYIHFSGVSGGAPGPNDLFFNISYSGTVQASSGDGAAYTGPDPGGYVIALDQQAGAWSAEFQISSAVIGDLFLHQVGLAVAQQSVNTPGDNYGWPSGYSSLIPNSWGRVDLVGLSLHLPALIK